MDARIYKKIYSMLEPSNIKRVSRDFSVDEWVLSNILNQKLQRSDKALYYKVVNDGGPLLERWENGESFVSLSKEMGFSTVLMALILLKHRGMGRREIQKMLKCPEGIKDRRLSRELSEVVKKDFIFSPNAHLLQREKARMGEEFIRDWLLGKDIDFLTEKEIKERGGTKTPDFLLENPLKIDGMGICWIDSKGLFGDESEHRRFLKKQFLEYIELFGAGMVVYWYGFVDSVIEKEQRVLVKDNTYFGIDNALYIR